MSPFQRTFPKGKTIFYEDDRSQDIYIIKEGKVGIFKTGKIGQNRIQITTLTKGALFGEMAMIDGKARSASAEVLEEAELHIISIEEFDKVLSKVPPWYLSIIKVLSSRIRDADKKLKLSIEFDHTANISQLLGLIHKRNEKTNENNDSLSTIDLKFAKKEIMQVLSVNHPTVNESFNVLEKKEIIKIENNKIQAQEVDDLFLYADYLRNGEINISDVETISPLTLKVFLTISKFIKTNKLKGKTVEVPIKELGSEALELFSQEDFLMGLSELRIIKFSAKDLENISPESTSNSTLQIDPIRLKDLIASQKFGD